MPQDYHLNNLKSIKIICLIKIELGTQQPWFFHDFETIIVSMVKRKTLRTDGKTVLGLTRQS